MFKPFKTPPTEVGYYLWKNFNSLFENNDGLNIFYLFNDQTAILIGTDIKKHITSYFFSGYWLGPYGFEFIKRKVKNPAVDINSFNQSLSPR